MDEFTDSFYLTLTSWDMVTVFPDNGPGDFYSQLAQPQDLRGSWEVALRGLFLRKLWYNVNEGENHFSVAEKKPDTDELKWTRHQIPVKEYQSTQELLDKLNTFAVAKFEYSDSLKTVTVKIIKPDVVKKITFADGLAMTLGFPIQHVIEKPEETAPYLMQLDKPREFALITCDLVEPRAIGSHAWCFLKLIHTASAAFGDHLIDVLDPEYIPLNKKSFHGVRICVRDVNNDPIPFQVGETVVILHFRRI